MHAHSAGWVRGRLSRIVDCCDGQRGGPPGHSEETGDGRLSRHQGGGRLPEEADVFAFLFDQLGVK